MQLDQFLRSKGVAFEVIPHRDTYDAQHMAEALHVSGKLIAKTVLLRADRGFAYVVAIVPACRRIDLEKASLALGGSRLEIATEVEIAERCTDCEFGVLPPFGSQYGMKTLVDEELTHDDWIIFEGNTHHESIRIGFADFQRVEQPLVARISAPPAPVASGH